MCTPEDGMVCLTRDTFGFAMKSTDCVINGKEYTIQKNPKTDQNHLKKSHKGLCCVTRDGDNFVCHDGYTSETLPADNLLRTVYRDGQFVRTTNFAEIRERLNVND